MSFNFAVCLATMFGLAAIGQPVSLAMIVASIVYLLMKGQDLGLAAEQMIQGLYDGFVILAVPLFIVAAGIMNVGTISDRLLHFCNALVGRFKGGMGHVNIVASLIFSGMSGSAVADAAGIGKINIDMMTKNGRYTPGYAAAVTAASAVIGPIIPPSIPMVLYALISDASIGYLFLGGIVPGLLMTVVMMLLNARLAVTRNFPVEKKVPLREWPKLTMRAFPALMMPVILLSGIYGGATTPTEAAAIAAAYALLLAVFFYRAVGFRELRQVFLESSRSSASVGLVIGSALIFNYVVASENIPGAVSNAMKGLEISPLLFLALVNILFLVLGCLLDATTLILVIVPLFVPTCKALGIDLVHFGVVIVVNCMIGLITPPYGMLLFVINGVTGIAIKDMVKEGLPFLLALLLALAALTLFPELLLFLPRMFGYEG
jgi:TRAP-type transport system large permease protein